MSRLLLLSVALSFASLSGRAHAEEPASEKHAANRLAKETSPYLLLHAHNPVDWYPWGEEALARAKRENKIIFLSIGYSSCFWCHVMERESFMDEEIAKYLNEHFVCVKVDREERPDIDEIYMRALQALGQRGGWPLSMFLTPDARPIFGGTYFPPRTKDEGLTGFLDVLKRVQSLWTNERQKLLDQADALTKYVGRTLDQRPLTPADKPGEKFLDEVQAYLVAEYDAEHGGFGYNANEPRQPKFPEPANLVFLLHRARGGDEKAREMLLGTLDHLARGGIRDHLGGGFHRYSTDRYWRVPHFEKMLYDNGQLASVYAESFALTKEAQFRRVVAELAEYIRREMTSPEGAFYAALDAETDAEEGAFYVWTTEELQAALSPVEFKLVGEVYGTSGKPNFEGRHVLTLPVPLDDVAKRLKLSREELIAQLDPVKVKLLAVRNERERPLTDTKILTAWNGLMIAGLADAGRVFEEPEYTAAASRAADFVLANLRDRDGRLLRTYAGGEAKLNAYLDDYAFLIRGLLALHQATGERRWLDAADALLQKQIELFWDEKFGGFYFTSDDHEQLIARSKDPADSATPSGNAVSASNLVYLAAALDDETKRKAYRQRARETIDAFAHLIAGTPGSMPSMGSALIELEAAEN